MQRIILFRFHKAFEVCVNRLEHLRRLNPGIPIYGIYGGEHFSFELASRTMAPFFEEIWEIPLASGVWNWKNGDLALLQWFRSRGKDLEFDVAHLIEWDLLILAPLEEVYGTAGLSGAALTGVTPLERIGATWYWTSEEPAAGEWNQLKEHIRLSKGYNGPYFACQGPANVLSRAFLEAYADEDVPDLGNEEVRLAIYPLALGFEITSLSNIYREIQDPEEMTYFNCEGIGIKRRTIRRELKNPNGRRVFHPYRKAFDARRRWWWF